MTRTVIGPFYPCEWHKPSGLSYLAWHEDAEQRTKNGEKQKRCPVCRRYFWPHEYGEKPAKRRKKAKQLPVVTGEQEYAAL